MESRKKQREGKRERSSEKKKGEMREKRKETPERKKKSIMNVCENQFWQKINVNST